MSVPLELFPVFLTQVRLPLKNSNVESGVVSPAFRLVQACHYGFFFCQVRRIPWGLQDDQKWPVTG